MAFKQLIINYLTAATVPPPYSFACSVILTPRSEGLRIDFSQNYTDRDELEEDEITAEGFTLNDDFAWTGTLPVVWLKETENLFKKTEWTDEAPEDGGESAYLEVSLGDADPGIRFPENYADWDYLIHELIQAVYEAGGKENPFHLEYVDFEKGQKKHLQVEASFVLRKVNLLLSKQPPLPLQWEILQEIFDLIYHQADFISENGTPQPPSGNGSYLSAGDGLWYKLDEGIVNVNPKNKATKNIRSLFERLHDRSS